MNLNQKDIYRDQLRRARIEIIIEYLRQNRRAKSNEIAALVGQTTCGTIKFLQRLQNSGVVVKMVSGFWEINPWFWDHGSEIHSITTLSSEPRGIVYIPKMDGTGMFWWGRTDLMVSQTLPFGTYCKQVPRVVKHPAKLQNPSGAGIPYQTNWIKRFWLWVKMGR